MKYRRIYKCNACSALYYTKTMEMVGKSEYDIAELVKKRINDNGHTEGKYPIELHKCNSHQIATANFVGIDLL